MRTDQGDTGPVQRVAVHPERAGEARLDAWPFTLPAVAQLMREGGLDLPPGVTFLVGENGSGKSTLVEAIAMAYGLNAEGGSRYARHTSRPSESPLHRVLVLQPPNARSYWGYFLRAETMHGLYTYLEENPGRGEPAFHESSHGESFLAVLRTRFDARGFYCLDEPESALSFSSCLALVGLFHDLARAGSQVLCATHSPLLSALPGATILELGEHGYRRTQWADLDIVDHWRRYLDCPQAYLRHVLD